MTGDNVDGEVKADRRLRAHLHRRQGLCAELRAQLPDRDRRLGRRQKLVDGARGKDDDFGNEWLKTNYAGSGPFKLREWRANEVVVLERNDNYSARKPPLARVIYRHMKESATQRLLLEKGDIDVARNLEPEDLDAVSSQPGHQDPAARQGHRLLFQPEPEEREPGQAGGARGVQISGRLRRDRPTRS